MQECTFRVCQDWKSLKLVRIWIVWTSRCLNNVSTSGCNIIYSEFLYNFVSDSFCHQAGAEHNTCIAFTAIFDLFLALYFLLQGYNQCLPINLVFHFF